MDPLAARLAAQGGVASVRQLSELGMSRQSVQGRVRTGGLVRVRRDAVVDASLWEAAAPWERHALRARAVAHSWLARPAAGAVALSHHSALVLLGMPVYGVDEVVHMVRTDGHPARGGPGLQMHASIDPAETTIVDGLPVVRGPLASLQVADAFGVEAGVVSADAVLHVGAKRSDLRSALEVGRFGRGAPQARLVTQIADGRMESPGESRARWLMRVCGLPEPEPQVTVRSRSGRSARVDFMFRAQRTVVEFDGRVKYQSARDLWDEKQREDWLRELGYEVVRLTWKELDDPGRVSSLILAAFRRSAVRRAS